MNSLSHTHTPMWLANIEETESENWSDSSARPEDYHGGFAPNLTGRLTLGFLSTNDRIFIFPYKECLMIHHQQFLII